MCKSTKDSSNRRWDQPPTLELGSLTTSSLMVARVNLRLDIPDVVRVVSCLVHVLTEGDVRDRLKFGLTLVCLLA